MRYKKKLQVFVSSTFIDLKEERQAAVEAILSAGHIPAGMELFASGDKSQMEVIKRWIDESDVYLLILGGRYGSVEKDSGKSYTQLEYEYAVDKGKALFAVVITDNALDAKVRKEGRTVLEPDHPQKLREFKDLVLTKMVKFWDDIRDIKLSVMQTLSEFNTREELIGWVPGSEVTNNTALIQEMNRLAEENEALRRKLSSVTEANALFNGQTFDELYQVLFEIPMEFQSDGFILVNYDTVINLSKRVPAFGDAEPTGPTLIHLMWLYGASLRGVRAIDNAPIVIKTTTIPDPTAAGEITREVVFSIAKATFDNFKTLETMGLLERDEGRRQIFGYTLKLSEIGKIFANQLMARTNPPKVADYVTTFGSIQKEIE